MNMKRKILMLEVLCKDNQSDVNKTIHVLVLIYTGWKGEKLNEN